MKWASLVGLTLVSCVVVASHSRQAHACGGCFHGSNESQPSVVTGHRMALSISPVRTVLWDQIEYTGEPTDFAWVLPVGPGAYVEESNDAWFEALEAVSATHVMSETLTCNGRDVRQQEGGFGCGGGVTPVSTDGPTQLGGHDQQGSRRVTVEHEGTVGPYQTATVSSGDPMALRDWLKAGGYVVPPEVDSVIDAYVAEGASFIALRLKPGLGVRQMKPVRVITPGASPILPLRMVAAGTGSMTSIVLYVIGEGRYEPQDKPIAKLDFSTLIWDWSASSSNYSGRRANALASGGYFTSFAAPNGLTEPVLTPDGTAAEYDVADTTTGENLSFDNLTDLYFGRASINNGIANECDGIDSKIRAMQPGESVAPKCEDPMGCLPPPKGQTPAEDLDCKNFTDVSTALVGLHPSDVWITRIEADLPRSELATDLTIAAATMQTPQENWHVAPFSVNPPCDPNAAMADTSAADEEAEADKGCGCATRRPVGSRTALVGTLVMGVALALRRRGRRGGRR